ncbi:hypothetical protein B4417_1014 [Bacillus subtilis]|nr:hypothetical protein B4417_1014 [Bacillus subtilis]
MAFIFDQNGEFVKTTRMQASKFHDFQKGYTTRSFPVVRKITSRFVYEDGSN